MSELVPDYEPLREGIWETLTAPFESFWSAATFFVVALLLVRLAISFKRAAQIVFVGSALAVVAVWVIWSPLNDAHNYVQYGDLPGWAKATAVFVKTFFFRGLASAAFFLLAAYLMVGIAHVAERFEGTPPSEMLSSVHQTIKRIPAILKKRATKARSFRSVPRHIARWVRKPLKRSGVLPKAAFAFRGVVVGTVSILLLWTTGAVIWDTYPQRLPSPIARFELDGYQHKNETSLDFSPVDVQMSSNSLDGWLVCRYGVRAGDEQLKSLLRPLDYAWLDRLWLTGLLAEIRAEDVFVVQNGKTISVRLAHNGGDSFVLLTSGGQPVQDDLDESDYCSWYLDSFSRGDIPLWSREWFEEGH